MTCSVISQQIKKPFYKDLLDLYSTIENLSNPARLVLEFFVRNRKKYDHIYFSQMTIAKRLGLSRETVNRAIAILHKHSLVVVNSINGYNTTNNYLVSPFFAHKKFRDKVLRIISTPRKRAMSRLSHTTSSCSSIFNNKAYTLSSDPWTTMLENFQKRVEQRIEISDATVTYVAKPENLLTKIEQRIGTKIFSKRTKYALAKYSRDILLHAAQRVKEARNVLNPIALLMHICKQCTIKPTHKNSNIGILSDNDRPIKTVRLTVKEDNQRTNKYFL